MSVQTESQTHLFVNHADEDSTFSDWLSLKLAGEGYDVWYDRIKLLGGESYPRDIDLAIKNQTFRFLTLLSRNSKDKANPTKERTLALSIAKQRNIDFVIPLNLDGLKAEELPWMTSDLTFISFAESWYDGFVKLLKKLDSVKGPKNRSIGSGRAVQWLSEESCVSSSKEVLWTNIFPVTIPRYLRQYAIPPEVDVDSANLDWPVFSENPALGWAFTNPLPTASRPFKEVNVVDWSGQDRIAGKKPVDLVGILARRTIEAHCLSKGIVPSPDRRRLYFPDGLVPKNTLTFKSYHGTRTSVKCVGDRKASSVSQERVMYHLAPRFRVIMDLFERPVVRLQTEIQWTDMKQKELQPNDAARHRKKLCRSWWNREWLSRQMAIMNWLTNGRETLVLGDSGADSLSISKSPIKMESSLGIREDRLKKQKVIAKALLVGEEEDAEIEQ